MRILIIGLGSIAKRHIMNLRSIADEAVLITVLRSGRGGPVSMEVERMIDRICSNISELEDYYDIIFITNPTSLHYDTLLKTLEYGRAFFIEKPVFRTGSEKIEVFEKTDKTYYVAAPLRYCNVIQWLKNHMDFSLIHSIRIISSSYLPDWRVGTDYRSSYSAHKELGGGVSIDLIHEWDYLTYLIGFPREVKSIICHKSNFEIDSDDLAVYIAEYDDKVVEIHLDYFGRKAQRKIELYAEDDTIIADLLEQKIYFLCSGKTIDLSEERDSYQKKELLHFLDIVNGKCESDNSIEEACRVLCIARGVV